MNGGIINSNDNIPIMYRYDDNYVLWYNVWWYDYDVLWIIIVILLLCIGMYDNIPYHTIR